MSASVHANFFVQKCVVGLPPENIHFIADEFRGRGAKAAKHAIRCRVLERIIEYFPPDSLAGIYGELIAHSRDLSRNKYGNFILQRALEHGPSEARHGLAEVLKSHA